MGARPRDACRMHTAPVPKWHRGGAVMSTTTPGARRQLPGSMRAAGDAGCGPAGDVKRARSESQEYRRGAETFSQETCPRAGSGRLPAVTWSFHAVTRLTPARVKRSPHSTEPGRRTAFRDRGERGRGGAMSARAGRFIEAPLGSGSGGGMATRSLRQWFHDSPGSDPRICTRRPDGFTQGGDSAVPSQTPAAPMRSGVQPALEDGRPDRLTS
jgi:hypothetical protein